ncbi:MAG: transcriptional repressor [Clostridia bacterium]|nr:MAG: transcriptional repressor [Clostridia bacterium]
MAEVVKRRVEEMLGNRDYRRTPQRQAILSVLAKGRGQHLTALEILKASREIHPEIGLATVYRNLEFLERAGVVARLHGDDGLRRYELSPTCRRGQHHHLVCLGCGGWPYNSHKGISP